MQLPHFDRVTLLETPTEGIPELIYTPQGLERAITALSQGIGPTAVDTEFAQGIRYDGRAFVLQLRREGAGTWIIDAEALGDLSGLSDCLKDTQWVVHAAAQDLLALEKRNMYPEELFDTELSAKLLGVKKSSLTQVTEKFLGVRLAKEHQLHDWSQRPLPQTWLNYAALDVELLLPLRNTLVSCLKDIGRLPWAIAESEFIRQSYSAQALAAKREGEQDPWRKTSHLSSLKTRRQYAVVRELWFERDKIARAKDVHPRKVLSDRTLIALAQQTPHTIPQLLKTPGTLSQRRQARRWLNALQRAYRLKDANLPPTRVPGVLGMPPPNSVRRKNAAAGKLHAAKQKINAKAEELGIPPENLISPEIIRKLVYDQTLHVADCNDAKDELGRLGARQWQIEIVAPLLTKTP